jgi:hypothetical protein
MRLLKLSILFWVLALPATPAAVAADDEASAQCAFAPVIVEAADLVLEKTTDVSRFWRDRLGSDAAYLKIHYADIGYDEARALLRSLSKRERPPERIEELRLAHASAADRVNDVAELRRAWPDRVPIILGPSGLRATVEQNGPDWLVDEVLLWHDKRFGLLSTAVEQLPDALAGIEEAKLTRLAERFERAGQWSRAVDLLSIKADLSDAMALIEKSASPPHKPTYIARLINLSAVRPAFEPSMQPAAGRPAEALEELRLAGDRQQARTVAHELMLRLDRQCFRHYGHPLAFQPGLYRFD